MTGDNLELNDLGGFHRVFSSGRNCSYCLVKYEELPQCDGFVRHKLRDSETYDKICDSLEQGSEVEDTLSLRKRCIFNKLESFHATTSLAPDLLHDFFEGVVPYDLLSVLKCFRRDNSLFVEAYNKKLRYGTSEISLF
jgi:hypothetical protein